MAGPVRSFAELRASVDERSWDRPPAIVCNAHITGLAVSRALANHDVPVIALDRSDRGVAPYSTAVDLAGHVAYPLDDADRFRQDLETLADAMGPEPVIFACMDEWVHATVETTPDGVRRPFADRPAVEAVLDKDNMYALASDLEIPIPKTIRLAGRDPDDVADKLGLPLVVKPARKREFEELLGTNVVEVETRSALHDIVDQAREADVAVMAQEKVPVAVGADRSVVSYVPPAGREEALAVVGNTRRRHPAGYGTGCLVRTVEDRALTERALAILDAAGYHGISEAEFVYDEHREEYVLLDVNTRPWKWIGLPVAAGANLPMAAYADAVEMPYASTSIGDATWVALADYLRACADDPSAFDLLSPDQQRALLAGSFENRSDLTTAVYAPSDPGPARQLVATALGTTTYYCSC